MKNIFLPLFTLSLVTVANAAMTDGQIIGIDFGTTASVGATLFNDYSDVTISAGGTESFIATGSLVDTTGATISGVGFSVTNNTGQDTGRATGNTGAEGFGLMTDSTVYSDWIISNDANGARLTDGDTVIDGSGDRGHLVLTFTGLDDNLTYNLTGGFDNNNVNFNAIWQADGKTFTTDTSGTGYGSLTELNTDGSGNLVINVIRPSNTDAQHVTIAGLTLEAVTSVASAPAIALGDVIRVDFGTTIPSGNYNVINSNNLSIIDLVRFSDGSAVDVDLAVTATTPFDNAANVASTAGLANIDNTDVNVYGDGFLSTNGSNGEGNDIITLTFTGLDDSLYYDVVGGLSRSSSGSNFATSWAASGAVDQVTDGTAANGYVAFASLESSGGTLVLTLTDTVRQSGLTQLSLAATDTPPPPPPLPPAPVLPDGVTVSFDPTATDGSVAQGELDYMTIGGTWATSLPSDSRFAANTADGFRYAMDGASVQGDYIELMLDSGLDFSGTDVAINFEMLSTRASTATDKHTTLIGYDGADEIFRMKYVSHATFAQDIITVTTGDGDESMGFTPLKHIAPTVTPSGLQDFRIVLSGSQVSFSGSSLTAQDGPVLNSAQTLTSLRWEITGTSTDNQGFWLDDVHIRNGLPSAPRAATDRPNIIFMLMDDMGYSDVSIYGGGALDTPNLDALATNGLQFTSFFLPGNVCSPTRASFLTGAYPSRCGIPTAVNHPNQNHWFLGLDPDEITIAEQCRSRGYKTFMVGKWHLGVEDVFLPHNQGFDHWYGTYGNGGEVYDEREIAHESFPASTLTSLYTQRVRQHIRDAKDQPFFIYYPHNYPHDPFEEGNAFDGSSGATGSTAKKRRSDALKEVDWGIGQIIAELEAQGILENTMFVFTSDNGATPPYASHGNAPFRGSKYVTWDGGHRVPFIIYWKGQILTPAELESPQVWAMDLFPTVAELIGEPMPTDRVYDGTSLVPLLTDQSIARAANETFYYYNGDNLQCVREGDWKLHVPRTRFQVPWWDQMGPPSNDPPSDYRLYYTGTVADPVTGALPDPSETTDISASHPTIVADLTAKAAAIRLVLGDADPATGSLVMGSGQRGTGTLFPEVPVIINTNSDYANVPDWNSLTDVERGRGKTREGKGDISVGAEFIDGTVLPAGWQYLEASEATGGFEAALTAASTVGTEGNTGFSGADTAGLIGSADVGSFVIDTGNAGNNGVEGTDLLITTDEEAFRDHVIVRYTIEAHDVSFGKTRASISGSFRDLVGGTSDDSVVVHVFHNTTELFTATGSAGQLLQAAGTFALSDVSVVAGDTISFVVGSNGNAAGDEVALNASIQFESESSPMNASHDFALSTESGMDVSGGIATFQFQGTPGLNYFIERTSDLTDDESWEVVDEIPFLPTAQYDVHVESGEEPSSFWRISWGE